MRYNMDKIKRENVFRYSPSVYYTSLKESEDRRKYMKKMLDEKNIEKIGDRDVYVNKEYVRRFVEDLRRIVDAPSELQVTEQKKSKKKK